MSNNPSQRINNGQISWWCGCIDAICEPRSLFTALSDRRPTATALIFPLLTLFSVIFATNFWLFSNRDLVEDLLKSEEQRAATASERQAADDRREAIERTLERPGMAALVSLQNVWVTMYSIVGFWSLVWLLNGMTRGSWAAFSAWCSTTSLSTIVLTLGAIVNTLMRLAFRRGTATVSAGFFIHGYDARNILHFLGSSYDLFTIWYLTLIAMSTSVFSRQRFWGAFLLVTGLWLVILLCSFLTTSSFSLIF